MFSYVTKKVKEIFTSFKSFKDFLFKNGHTKRKFVGYHNSPSHIVLYEIMKEHSDSKLTAIEWHSLVNEYSNDTFYGEMPLATIRGNLCKLFNMGKIKKSKQSNSRKKLYYV